MKRTTNRLLIRSFEESDIEHYFKIVSDPRVMKFLWDGSPHDFETAKAYVHDCIARENADGITRFAVIWRKTGQLIGFSGFKRMSGVIDFGYRFAAPFWGQGIATEAGQCVLNHGFGGLGLETITARVVPENAASAAVLRKLHFRPWQSPPLSDDCHDWYVLEK